MNRKREVKNSISNFVAISICLLLFTSVYSQVINPPKYSDETIEEIRFRKENRIKSYRWRSSDTLDYYVEHYNETGLLFMTTSNEFDTTIYEHDSNGMIIKCYEIIEGVEYINYTAAYKDSIISVENWESIKDYRQLIKYNSEGKRIKDLKIFRNSSRIDSTITTYLDKNNIETKYEKGSAVLIINNQIYPDSIIRKFNKISNLDTLHYMVWSNYFDERGNKVRRKQTFLDKEQSTEYLNEFDHQNELISSSILKNGVLDFKTIYERNQKGKVIMSSTYYEKDDKTITKYYYSPNGFDVMLVISAFKDGILTNKEEWYEDYEFYE